MSAGLEPLSMMIDSNVRVDFQQCCHDEIGAAAEISRYQRARLHDGAQDESDLYRGMDAVFAFFVLRLRFGKLAHGQRFLNVG